jgi:hypothetical protein
MGHFTDCQLLNTLLGVALKIESPEMDRMSSTEVTQPLLTSGGGAEVPRMHFIMPLGTVGDVYYY